MKSYVIFAHNSNYMQRQSFWKSWEGNYLKFENSADNQYSGTSEVCNESELAKEYLPIVA